CAAGADYAAGRLRQSDAHADVRIAKTVELRAAEGARQSDHAARHGPEAPERAPTPPCTHCRPLGASTETVPAVVASAATTPKSRSEEDDRLSDRRTMPRALAVAVADEAAT